MKEGLREGWVPFDVEATKAFLHHILDDSSETDPKIVPQPVATTPLFRLRDIWPKVVERLAVLLAKIGEGALAGRRGCVFRRASGRLMFTFWPAVLLTFYYGVNRDGGWGFTRHRIPIPAGLSGLAICRNLRMNPVSPALTSPSPILTIQPNVLLGALLVLRPTKYRRTHINARKIPSRLKSSHPGGWSGPHGTTLNAGRGRQDGDSLAEHQARLASKPAARKYPRPRGRVQLSREEIRQARNSSIEQGRVRLSREEFSPTVVR